MNIKQINSAHYLKKTNVITIKQALTDANQKLINSDTAQLDSELLLCHILNQPRSYLFTWPEQELNKEEYKKFENLIKRRIQGEPIAYITGNKEFWSLQLSINSDVLIPRPETELIIEICKHNFSNDQLSAADLGTGSGAIALALAKEFSNWEILATDISNKAIMIANKNREHNKIKNVTVLQSDWCQNLPHQNFDIIVSNPPYIAKCDPHLQQGDVQYEPRTALIAGDDGLEAFNKIAAQVKQYLKPKGWILLEHGFQQGREIRNLLDQYGYSNILTYRDMAGHERVTCGQIFY